MLLLHLIQVINPFRFIGIFHRLYPYSVTYFNFEFYVSLLLLLFLSFNLIGRNRDLFSSSNGGNLLTLDKASQCIKA